MNKDALVDPIKTALQGLAYWISYRQILYGRHSLNEGALVVEFVNLLNAKLSKEFKIDCESEYEGLKERMDVKVLQKDAKGAYSRTAAIIEFKRYLEGKNKSRIEKDMKKLSKPENSEALRFLVVVSEKKLPEEYVGINYCDNCDSGNVTAIRKNLSPDSDFSAHVIGVFKSAGALRGRKKSLPNMNYCCLIEVEPSNKRSPK